MWVTYCKKEYNIEERQTVGPTCAFEPRMPLAACMGCCCCRCHRDCCFWPPPPLPPPSCTRLAPFAADACMAS